MFEVMSKACDQCLLSPRKIVSDARRRQIMRDTVRKDCSFICHKASISGRDVACRLHYDATGGGQLARIAGRFGMVRFVDPETLEHVDVSLL
ncbi:MAG: hypothetical protein PHZ23_15960 [Acidiphilium sp.]|nr:hypothetical protein [Acidiphilium sp.]